MMVLLTGCSYKELFTKGNDIIYVKAGSNEARDGSSWSKAFNSLQDALKTAEKGDQIWVAQGIYYPTDNDDRSISFTLKEGVEVYGGFSGQEKNRAERDWQKNETILSGDIGQNHVMEDNTYHVVTGADNAILDGFIIEKGYAFPERSGEPPAPGAAPKNTAGSSGNFPGSPENAVGSPPGSAENISQPAENGKTPVHTTPENIVQGNTDGQGGGMINFQTSPIIKNCTFRDNQAMAGGGMYNMIATTSNPKKALENTQDTVPKIINTTFINNFAEKRGGGVFNNLATSPIYIDTRFIENICDAKGGGMYNDFGCSPLIYNCLFVGNTAVSAGAMGNDGTSNPTIMHTTIADNYAEDVGAGLYQGSGKSPNTPTVINSIIWGNECPYDVANIYNWHESNVTITNSAVEGGYVGDDKKKDDPLFLDPEAMNYDLSEISPYYNEGIGYNSELCKQRSIDRYNNITAELVNASITQPESNIVIPEPQVAIPVQDVDVVYVVADGREGTWDGTSWDTAFRNLQTAIDYANLAGDAQVWVAGGTYTPTDTVDRSKSFYLREGVKVYGGFAGNETSIEQRDINQNKTVLSGNIGDKNTQEDNVYHVLVGANDALLDGCTITGGYADGKNAYHCKGGGLINYPSGAKVSFKEGSFVGYSTVIQNSTFSNNYAQEGGAVYNYNNKTSFTKVNFLNNSASYGGAVVDRVGVESVYKQCVFKQNLAGFMGAALYLDYGSLTKVQDSVFENNTASSNGGAMYLVTRASQVENTDVKVTNSKFIGNEAGHRGGAVYNFDQSLLEIADSGFVNNIAAGGGGAVATDYLAETTLANCTFNPTGINAGANDTTTDDAGVINK